MRRKFLIALLAFFCGVAGAKAENGNSDKDWEITAVHRSIVSEKGWLNTSRPLTADDLKGRIILLDFWTYCCINCMHVIPELRDLEKTYGDKLTIIGVHSAKFQNERDQENIRSAILRYDIEHPVVNDRNFEIWQRFDVNAWPTLILINPLGRIEKVFTGEGNLKKIKSSVDDMLKSYSGLLNISPLPISLEKNKSPKTVLSFPGKLIYVEDYEGSPALFVSDSGNNRILGIRTSGEIFMEIGSGKPDKKDGGLTEASFNGPQGLLYRDNILYVADTNNHLLRKVDLKNQKVSTIAGTGKQGENRNVFGKSALDTALSSPWDLAFYPDAGKIAIAMAGLHQIWDYDIDKRTLSVIAGNGYEDIKDGAYPFNSLAQTSGLSVAGNRLYFVDSETSSLRYLEDGQVKTLIGKGLFDFGFIEGDADRALMQHPLGLYATDKEIFVADSYNHSIRKYIMDSGKLENFLGNGTKGSRIGSPSEARFNEPADIAIGNDKIFIADTNNNEIKIYDEGSNKISLLDVMPTMKSEEIQQYQENLPNLKILPFKKVSSSKDIKVSFILPKNYKINKEAPSWISLFAVDGVKFNFITSYDQEKMHENSITLPKLDAGKSYKLQGTFYYCQDKAGAQCYIRSVDELIKAEEQTKASTVHILFDKPVQ